MKPAPFAYYAPKTIDEAVEILGRDPDGSKVLAGGQSLVPMMNLRLATIDHLVDLNRIEGLDGVRVDSGRVVIGAGARQSDVERSPAVREALPMLPTALGFVGHFANRNRGTVVGSICHADPAAEMPATWLTVGGELTATGPSGTRTLSSDGFFEGFLTTALEPGEVVTEVSFNTTNGTSAWSFQEVARRHGDFAMVGVATLLSVEGGSLTEPRIVVFAAGSTPMRMAAAEQLLVGLDANALDDALLDQVAAEVSTALSPSDDVHASGDYRRHVAGVLTRRGLRQSLARTP